MILRSILLRRRKLFSRAVAFVLRVWLAAAAVLLVALMVTLSSAAAGPYSIDVTFDVLPTSLQFSEIDRRQVDDEQGIRCSDETSAFNDGVSWVRCRFVASEINDAKRYLHRHGLQTGDVYRNVRIKPVSGGYGFYVASVVIAAALIILLGKFFGWHLSSELKLICNLGWRVLAVLIAPTALCMALAWLIFWAIGIEPSQTVVQSLSPSDRISLMVAAILIAPVLEELLYRGLVFDLLQRASGAVPACLVGTGFFVVSHGAMELWDSGIPRLVMLGVVSVCLYAIRVRFGSLILCIGAHAFFNAVVVLAWLSTAG
ncbi:CPBP family intramembrane glutamic endopeptidase [uncultured Stenotrophomonas sp.]|uniref:CPBP family intramembrane glutamic endopeptidase n=1 Tax=uncultured Stenotrophomonas sp. TaxID=165438 RepID=UPI0025D8E29B|nr:CPBP family intramembrane glutamic endopeptidase [uncultured Stenotrophomonas sp.]